MRSSLVYVVAGCALLSLGTFGCVGESGHDSSLESNEQALGFDALTLTDVTSEPVELDDELEPRPGQPTYSPLGSASVRRFVAPHHVHRALLDSEPTIDELEAAGLLTADEANQATRRELRRERRRRRLLRRMARNCDDVVSGTVIDQEQVGCVESHLGAECTLSTIDVDRSLRGSTGLVQVLTDGGQTSVESYLGHSSWRRGNTPSDLAIGSQGIFFLEVRGLDQTSEAEPLTRLREGQGYLALASGSRGFMGRDNLDDEVDTLFEVFDGEEVSQ